MDAPDGVRCAMLILGAFIPVGCAHVVWLKSTWSRRFAAPIDFGAMLRGRRVFGANKMVRGFVIIVPGSALAFLLLSALGVRPWPLSPIQYAGLGACAGLGFILAELPNSFVKRQFDIDPGGAATAVLARAAFLVADRIDSLLGLLLAIRLFVPTPWLTWVIVLSAGVFIHASFSVALFRLGVKVRPL
jgi:CDP-2,3-bis-(O-geranylgeranyl)-sn-glycerol synthase